MTDTPFVKIKAFCRETGLSEYSVRKELANGEIPHIRRGNVVYIDRNEYLKLLHTEARENANATN